MKQLVRFFKMHGIGNDYVYLDCLDQQCAEPNKISQKITPRRFGVGGDGLVLILPSEKHDFRMQMFNNDGTEAEMCGNAVRCIGKYLYEKGHHSEKKLQLETLRGRIELEFNLSQHGNSVDSVRVDMGEPFLHPEDIPVLLGGERAVGVPYEIDGQSFSMTCVSVGNPHAVFFVDEITDEQVLGLGPKIETDPIFPRRTNVEFVKVISRNELEMRVWERGCGETWGCGTGASAVAVAAVLNGYCDREILIHLRGGDLQLEWTEDNHIFQTGPAEFVFEGRMEVDL